MAANSQPNSLFAPPGPTVTRIDPVSIPGFGPSGPGAVEYKKFSVKYAKIDFDDPASLAELEDLETKALRDEGIYVLTKDKFTFMDKYFLIVSYMEKEQTGVSLA
jgi:hypothetical protein